MLLGEVMDLEKKTFGSNKKVSDGASTATHVLKLLFLRAKFWRQKFCSKQ